MNLDLCKLTADVLPLYADDLLSPETRQALEEHAASCALCARLLAEAKAPPKAPLEPGPPGAPVPVAPRALTPEAAARRFFGRLRHWLFYGAAILLLLAIVAGSLGYRYGWRYAAQAALVPARVNSADELARRDVPGWARAEAQGLVMNIGKTVPIPNTNAWFTLEKGWFSGRQMYLLYTVKEPNGQFIMPTNAYLFEDLPKGRNSHGQTDWNHLNDWGGVSAGGFHSILVFDRFNPPPQGDQLKFQVLQWAPVSPENGLDPSHGGGGELSFMLPWRPDYLREPDAAVYAQNLSETWLGRTVTLEQLAVGTGRITLTGTITLPASESKPTPLLRLHLDKAVRDVKEINTTPTGQPGQYRFTAAVDGPDNWPVPVQVELNGIAFETDRTLEWAIPWAKYKNGDGHQLMEPPDQVAVPFYGSTLRTVITWSGGIAVEEVQPKGRPPYVQAAQGAGTHSPEETSGLELVAPDGTVAWNFGAGGGNISPDGRQGFTLLWWDIEKLPAAFRSADRFTLRYVHPPAIMVLKEIWTLNTRS